MGTAWTPRTLSTSHPTAESPPPSSNPDSAPRRTVPPTVSALSPSSFPLPHSLPPGTSPSRERCNPSRSRTRAPRRRKRIPKTLPSIFPASVKKSIGARWNNEELRNRLCVEKEYQEQIKEKYI